MSLRRFITASSSIYLGASRDNISLPIKKITIYPRRKKRYRQWGGDLWQNIRLIIILSPLITSWFTWTQWMTKNKVQGPVSPKLQKLFGSAKPVLMDLYLKMERCKRLKLLV